MRVTLTLLAYNEEAVIDRVVRDAADELGRAFAPGTWEILIINDGSRDATGDICEQLSGSVTGVRVYHHNPNRGYVEATLSALREARGEYVCIFDGDGQQTAADVRRFVEKLESGCDVVFGWKKVRYDPPARLILSRGLRWAARYFLHSRLHDINGGCRGFRKSHVEVLSVIKHRINFVGPELYTRARLNDLRICEIVVRHFPREGGETSHAWGKIPSEVRQVLSYLRALRAELREAG
ncbi:MAG TPA: glycosyltransferase family 2 protein, partial [Abditibacteriaceae bacterium]|nr:glycosyltransferase family 2 protein [Abditibacteriaceae bacterium]